MGQSGNCQGCSRPSQNFTNCVQKGLKIGPEFLPTFRNIVHSTSSGAASRRRLLENKAWSIQHGGAEQAYGDGGPPVGSRGGATVGVSQKAKILSKTAIENCVRRYVAMHAHAFDAHFIHL